jgi:hypothetical protein
MASCDSSSSNQVKAKIAPHCNAIVLQEIAALLRTRGPSSQGDPNKDLLLNLKQILTSQGGMNDSYRWANTVIREFNIDGEGYLIDAQNLRVVSQEDCIRLCRQFLKLMREDILQSTFAAKLDALYSRVSSILQHLYSLIINLYHLLYFLFHAI